MCGALFLAQFRLLRFWAVSLATKLIHPPGKLVGVSPSCRPSSSLRASTENTPLIPEAPFFVAQSAIRVCASRHLCTDPYPRARAPLRMPKTTCIAHRRAK